MHILCVRVYEDRLLPSVISVKRVDLCFIVGHHGNIFSGFPPDQTVGLPVFLDLANTPMPDQLGAGW